MSRLADMQRRFAEGVSGDAAPVLDLIHDDGRQADRFEIHRNNTFASLKSVLADAFPAVQTVLGEQMFQRLSAAFVRNLPPRMNHLLDYGSELPDFIRRSEPLSAWPFLGDLAALEWAVNAAYGAPDAASLGPDDLAGLPPEELVAQSLPLLPSASLIESEWPVHAVWMAPENTVDIAPRPQHVLVIRPDVDVIAIPLDRPEHVFLTALMSGASLGEAAVASQSADPAFDLQGALARHLAGGHFARTPNPEEGEP
ncbi:putative DNA-binding domain-containing protein [Minwuia sp.]|uniref:HvfC/BufC family peptide modification chaperone n=1 Tax=Minwuia sp. TaxID=2493630 RepID=UPI003A8D0F5B